MTFPAIALLAALYGDTPDEKHAWSVHDWHRPKPVKVTPAETPGGAPSDAVVLFDGTKASFERNWRDKNGKPSAWKMGEGYFYSVPGWKNGGDIYTRAEFGDCQLHIEYRHDPDNVYTNKGPQMRGNSGVFLMDSYEIQVLESYGTRSEGMTVDNYADGMAASVYAENPPLVNPQRKPGEWQVYDIVFHQPVWEDGKLKHPGSVSVFCNGVLVQDHWEMEGLTTHCVRKPLAPHAKALPLRLQDHGCMVQFRNIWYRPLKSRWDNKTHSSMSADPAAVMARRRQTAAALYCRIPDPSKADEKTLLALAEVIGYANEGVFAEKFNAALEAFREGRPSADEIKRVNAQLKVLVRNKVIAEDRLLKTK